MAPRLTVYPGSPEERSFSLGPGPTTIGRTQENDVFVLHKSLSRAHARLDVVGERVTLVDLGSKNGTMVDGVRIESRELGASHQIKFGDVPAVFQRAADAARAPAEDLPPPSLTRRTDLTAMSLNQLVAARSSAVAERGSSDESAQGRARDRERDRLRVLLKVSQLLSSPAPLEEVLESMLGLVFEILDVDRAAVLMVDRETGELEARAVRSRPGSSRAGDAPYSRSVARWVIDHGVAALFPDAAADPRLAEAKSIIAHSVKTTMAAPLMGREGTHGALYIDNLSRRDRFAEDDLELLSGFAGQAAIAMENAMLHERLARETATRQGLLRFFPKSAVATLMSPGSSRLAIIETEATALFSDLSGYTEMSSRMKPVEVIRLLNEYFPVMAEIVFRHEGTLEKYIGDALLAVWGAPLVHDDDPVRAVRAAIDMQRAIGELNRELAGRHTLAIHIGLNTGAVAAGNIGTDAYLQYATIGDATNVAARLCGLATAGQIVIGERTAAALVGTDVDVTPLGPATLKGKDRPQRVFRVEWA